MMKLAKLFFVVMVATALLMPYSEAVPAPEPEPGFLLRAIIKLGRMIDERPAINEDQNSEKDPTYQNTRGKEQQGSGEQQSSTTMSILNRRNNPPELIQEKKRMDEAFNFMQHYSQRLLKDEDDECSTFGVFVAKKLRKLSEERRDIVISKIHQLFIDEHAHNFSSSNSNSTATMSSYNITSETQINTASPPAGISNVVEGVVMISHTSSPPHINIASPRTIASKKI